jgi:hypothetical protein
MAVKKRCPYCLKKLREDGTCANPNCPRYVPENAEGDKAEDKDEEE